MHIKRCLGTVAAVLALIALVAPPAMATGEYEVGQVLPIAEVKAGSTPLAKPELKATGVPLVVSDSPETFTQTGAFYRDRLTGEFRVFFHHLNKTGRTVNVGAAVTNDGPETIMLYAHGRGAAVNIYPDVAGLKATESFLRTRRSRALLAKVKPGESYYFASPVPDQYTETGFVQFDARTQRGNQPAPVTVTILSYDEEPADPKSVSVLPLRSPQIRGTFPHSDRTGELHVYTSGGKQWLAISSAAFGRWANPMPGEYEPGISAVDGGKEVWNNGNYGVVYDFDVTIHNDAGRPMPFSVLDNPSGGFGHYAMTWNNEILLSPWISYNHAWVFAHFNLPARTGKARFGTSLVGGSSGPSKIFFVPGQ